MTSRKEKNAAEEQRTLAHVGEGTERPEEGSGLGIAAALLLVVLGIGFVVWWLRIIPGWHP